MEKKGLMVGAGLLLLILIVIFSFNSSQQNITGEPVRTLDGTSTGTSVMGGNTPGCSDSDGGLNYNLRGNTTNDTMTLTDYCYPNGQLVEYFCDATHPGAITASFVTCGDGYSCANGACVSSGGNLTCTDTDGGTNVYLKGTASNNTNSSTDVCSAYGSLIESYCSGVNVEKIIEFCPSGYSCANGACVSSCTPNCAGKTCGSDGCGGVCGTCSQGQFCDSGGICESFTCTDSDGGKIYNVPGTVNFNGFNYTDFCNTTIVLQEYSCTQNNMMDFNSYACPYGCENVANGGKCKTASPRKPTLGCKTAFCRLRGAERKY